MGENEEQNELNQLRADYAELKDNYQYLKQRYYKLRNSHSSIDEPSAESQETLVHTIERLNKELASIKENVTKLTEEINERDKKINLSNAIASAELDTRFVPAEIQSIENLRCFIVSKYLETFSRCGIPIESELKRSQINEWAEVKKKTWISNKTVAAFIGHFSSGKTTIINKILAEGERFPIQLPVELDPTTAIPTYIAGFSEGNSITSFCDANGQLKALAPSYFNQITKDQMKMVKIASQISSFVVTCPNKNLQNISILDTPGFESGDKEDEIRTEGALSEADVLFWTVNVDKGGLTNSALTKLKDYNIPLYIILTWCDKKSEKGIIKTENEIKKSLLKAGVNYQGIFRSTKTSSPEPIIASILSSKRREGKDSIIEELYVELDGYVQLYKSKIKALEKQKKEKERDLNYALNDIESQVYTIKGIVTSLKYMPVEKLFGGYKIPSSKWDTYVNKIDNIDDSANHFSDLTDSINTKAHGLGAIETEYNKLQEIEKSLSGLQREFNALFKSWNQSMLKNIKDNIRKIKK